MAMVLGKYYVNDFDEASAVKHLQQAIIKKDQVVTSDLKKLRDFHSAHPDSVFEFLDQSQHIEKNIFFFIRENDSLIFWSDNRVPVDFMQKQPFSGIVNTGNGWYRQILLLKNSYSYSGLYLIKHDYNYQNEYLKNDFNPSFGIDCKATLSDNPDQGYSIRDSNGYFLFSVVFHPSSKLTTPQFITLFLLYFFALLFFIGFIYEIYHTLYRSTGRYWIFIIGFLLDLAILRGIIFYFKFPRVLFNTQFFGPHFYANSDLIPSIGDLFLHSVFLFIAGFFFYHHVKFRMSSLRRNRIFKVVMSIASILAVFALFWGLIFFYRSLVLDSNISLDLNNIFSLSWMSLVSFFILSNIIFAFVLISTRLSYFAWLYLKSLRSYLNILAVIFAVVLIFCLITGHYDPFFAAFVFAYLVSVGIFFRYKTQKFSLPNIVFLIVAFSLITTYALHKFNNFKEKESRKLLAVNLAAEQRDPLAEFMFGELREKIDADSTITNFMDEYYTSNFDQQDFEDYFFRHYFTGYWKKYDHQATICDQQDVLMVQPENVQVDCFMFFENMIEGIGHKTNNSDLYFMNYGPGDNGYLAIFNFPSGDGDVIRLYVELTPKYMAKDLGFPDLLVDEQVTRNPDLSDYSYAKYQNGELYKRVGKYFYNIHQYHYGKHDKPFEFFNMNGYNHLFYRIDNHSALILSKKNKSTLDLLAPFSYLFIAFGLYTALIFLILIWPFSHRKMQLSFRTRLQMSMSALILVSFLVIGFFTLWYIYNLNDQKNQDILSEKTHSVLVEMQHKFSDLDNIGHDMSDYLSEVLAKFSNIFFTDINIFKLDGNLVATSRPQVFEEKLISRRMNPEAYDELKYKNSSLFIHTEEIGRQHYLSAYIPFVNNQNEVIAYINLPYFAKENDLRREISSFLVAYINIYVILIAISILIALVISNYISRPLKLIMQKIREVKLGGQNEKIDWDRKDEIGQLVLEYNRMIDALALSAELLARSERESAWREMARQVAHEIKNPLTPMKLSVQYLQRSWKEGSPDWEKRLNKFTSTMIEQIETLSAIATEFSDFAKMPLTKKEDVDICDVLHNSISLFHHYDNISIDLAHPEKCSFMVYADKEQLLRAFNNLLKNSVQAIGTNPHGRIDISVSAKAGRVVVQVSDNGGGIPRDLAEKIFSPNFTTKSGGMGLGLAIVKNVITLSGGTISYQSTEGKGTTFRITLPLSEN